MNLIKKVNDDLIAIAILLIDYGGIEVPLQPDNYMSVQFLNYKIDILLTL